MQALGQAVFYFLWNQARIERQVQGAVFGKQHLD